MANVLDKRLSRLLNAHQARFMRGGKKGIEKESLRVSSDGSISQTDHPYALGAPLTHPYITTDYSEALLEFVTPPFENVREAQQFLYNIHHFVLNHMEHDEMLWNSSMPCRVAGDESIRIAEYGSSNSGRFKVVYRKGLGYRYGRVMQTISGVHYNYSVPERFWPIFQNLEQDNGDLQTFISKSYLGMSRNVLRYSWLLYYLFGSSPAICKTFVGSKPHEFQEWDTHSLYEPFGTTLRMSNVGYKNEVIDNLHVSYNDLDSYIDDLYRATQTVYPPYSAFGVKVNGQYNQLNDHILQIENEFYSPVRPKRPPQKGERPLRALQTRGIGYVELRAIDINPYSPNGVSDDQMHFLEAFLLFCLLRKSPPITLEEREAINHNELLVARHGRKADLKLQHEGKERNLRQWASKLLQQMEGICEVLDGSREGQPFTSALNLQKEAVKDADRTPSARILADMGRKKISYHRFARELSQQHERWFRTEPLPFEQAAFFAKLAADSRREQAELEAAEQESFETYLERYFAQG